jgi:hypothetical protein
VRELQSDPPAYCSIAPRAGLAESSLFRQKSENATGWNLQRITAAPGITLLDERPGDDVLIETLRVCGTEARFSIDIIPMDIAKEMM